MPSMVSLIYSTSVHSEFRTTALGSAGACSLAEVLKSIYRSLVLDRKAKVIWLASSLNAAHLFHCVLMDPKIGPVTVVSKCYLDDCIEG